MDFEINTTNAGGVVIDLVRTLDEIERNAKCGGVPLTNNIRAIAIIQYLIRNSKAPKKMN